jgi:hypothetical protein
VDEAWERLTDDPEVRGVETARIDEIGGWQVTVWVMEFVRQDPLEIRRRIGAALRAVERVIMADEEDREVWFVTGTPSGRNLTAALRGWSMNWLMRPRDNGQLVSGTALARLSHRPSLRRQMRSTQPSASSGQTSVGGAPYRDRSILIH